MADRLLHYLRTVCYNTADSPQYKNQKLDLRETGSVRILSRSADCSHFGAETEQSARLCSALMAGLLGGTPGLSETRESAQK